MTPDVPTEGTALVAGALAASEIRQRIREALEDKDAEYPVPGHPPMRPDAGFVDLIRDWSADLLSSHLVIVILTRGHFAFAGHADPGRGLAPAGGGDVRPDLGSARPWGCAPGVGLERPPGVDAGRPPGVGVRRLPGAGTGRIPGAGAERPPGVFGAHPRRCPGAGVGRSPGVRAGRSPEVRGARLRRRARDWSAAKRRQAAAAGCPKERGGDDGDRRRDGCPCSHGRVGGGGDRGGSVCLRGRGGGGSGDGDGDLRPGGLSGGGTGGGGGRARSRDSGRNGGATLGGCGGG
uniref:Uncharacterized protein n=1 Tax=Setaria viridis TaxID=4556 RepID=A0A4U6VQX0_SETVI|nr:hypothetical protein SEVIR_2G073100v2 [Setaria viridis]